MAVVDDFPVFVSVGSEVAAPMRAVGIVHEEDFLVRRVGFATEQRGDVRAV